MKQQHYSPTRGEVLEPTDARQANSRKMNLRVLIFSTSLIVLVFAGFVLAFLYATPAPMDGSSQEGAQSWTSHQRSPGTEALAVDDSTGKSRKGRAAISAAA